MQLTRKVAGFQARGWFAISSTEVAAIQYGVHREPIPVMAGRSLLAEDADHRTPVMRLLLLRLKMMRKVTTRSAVL